MHRKIYKTLIQLVVIALNTQLMFGPLAYANQQAVPGQAWQNIGMYANQFSSMMSQATQAYMQGSQGGPDAQIAQIEAQLSPMLKIRPIDPAQVPPVFNGCLVLPAGATTLTGNMSCQKATDPQVQSGYTEAVMNIAEFNKKQLETFLTPGHERFTSQGVGCYDKKIEDFEGMMLAREERLNKFKMDLTAKLNKFKLDSKSDRESMKKDNALLTGTPAKYLKDVKFQDYFFGGQDNSVCASVYSPDTVASAGSGGLEAIEDLMFKRMNNKSSLGYTPDEILTKSREIKADIGQLVNGLASNTKRKEDLTIDLGSSTVNSKYFTDGSKALVTAINNYNKEVSTELDTLKDELKVNQAVNGSKGGQSILSLINDGNIDLDRRLKVYERDAKKECVATYIKSNWGSIENFTKEFRNPNVSRKLNKRADNAFASEMANWISNEEATVDQVWEKINQTQKKGLNSQKIIITGKSFSLDNGQTISASTPLRASQLYKILADNCKKRYTSVKNADGFTQKDMVEKLKKYGNKLERMRKTAASNIKKTLKNQLLECPNDTATGSGALSCSDALNIETPTFCLRTAQTCAGNFKGCHAKVRNFKETVRENQMKTATKYNNEVGKLKAEMEKDLKSINRFMESQARSLDAQLRMGTVFKVPPLAFNLNDNFIYTGEEAQGMPEELNIEDPAKILEMAVTQIDLLTGQLQEQKATQIAKLRAEADKYAQNYATQKGYWEGVIAQCEQRNQQFDQAYNDSLQKAAESDEKIKKACMELQAFNAAPDCEGVEDIMSTVQEAMLLTPPPSGRTGVTAQMANYYDQQTLRNLQQIKRDCGAMDDSYPTTSALPADYDIYGFCKEYVKENKDANMANFAMVNECKNKVPKLKSTYRKPCTQKELAQGINNKFKYICQDENGNYQGSQSPCGKPTKSSSDIQSEIDKMKEVGDAFKEIAGVKSSADQLLSGKDLNSSITKDQIADLWNGGPEIPESFWQGGAKKWKDVEAFFKTKFEEDSEQLMKDHGINDFMTAKAKIEDEEERENFTLEDYLEDKNETLTANKKVAEEVEANPTEKITVTAKNAQEVIMSLYASKESAENEDAAKLLSESIQIEAECYLTDPELAPEALVTALSMAESQNTVKASGRQMGEKNIAAAMCNGGYDGMFESHGGSPVMDAAQGALDVWTASMQEGIR